MRALLVSLAILTAALPAHAQDPFLWLEDIEGQKALQWVKSHNDSTLAELQAFPEFAAIRDQALKTLDSEEKLLEPRLVGTMVYNFWRDQHHVRGILRRLPLESFLQRKLDWETVLDMDALAARENENWVYGGMDYLPGGHDRGLLSLSRGGGDARVVREFDLAQKDFVAGGFALPEAKTEVAWKDRETLYVGTDFGPGSMTQSGYPRICKQWRRGTPLSQALTILEVPPGHLGIDIQTIRRPGESYDVIGDSLDFYHRIKRLRREDSLQTLDLPTDSDLHTIFHDRAIVELRSAWKGHPQGALVSVSLKDGVVAEIYRPGPGSTIQAVRDTRDELLVALSENVKTQIFRFIPEGPLWKRVAVKVGGGGSTSFSSVASDHSDFFLSHQDFLSPTALYYVNASGPRKIQQLPASFDAAKLEVHQWWAPSKDGTKVPYYVVSPKKLKLDGTAPTMLYGYGGFQVSILPDYLNLIGPAWLERGGVYVSANIRGGGEFGPAWHQAALREKRPRAYEDFEAVAEDLTRRHITSPRHLGIHGRSNGGLLMGAELTRRPDLFQAVLCGVPLLDMQRYHKLLAGASWMAEYGDPDKPADWAFLKGYSPYHNLKPGVKYPKPLIYTSTKDDRVHPGHARKMAARMESMGYPVYYYENLEGGHAGVTNNAQRAFVTALSYTYLGRALR